MTTTALSRAGSNSCGHGYLLAEVAAQIDDRHPLVAEFGHEFARAVGTVGGDLGDLPAGRQVGENGREAAVEFRQRRLLFEGGNHDGEG